MVGRSTSYMAISQSTNAISHCMHHHFLPESICCAPAPTPLCAYLSSSPHSSLPHSLFFCDSSRSAISYASTHPTLIRSCSRRHRIAPGSVHGLFSRSSPPPASRLRGRRIPLERERADDSWATSTAARLAPLLPRPFRYNFGHQRLC